MRFTTDFKLLSLFLSVSIAAPMAQYFASVPAGNPIDNGIESSSNTIFTDESSPGMVTNDELLMAARRQRPDRTRYRPSQQQPTFRDTTPDEKRCLPKSAGTNCQPESVPNPVPDGDQSDIPDPWLDDPSEAAGGALGFWGLWNLLNSPSPALSN